MLHQMWVLAALFAAAGTVSCVPVRDQPCVDGMAGPYPCSNIDLAAFVPLSDLGAPFGSSASVVGYTHEPSGREFALIGLHNGTAVVEVTTANQPHFIGRIAAGTDGVFSESLWRELEVYNDHAFIVSEANGHALSIVDLRPILNVEEGSGPIDLVPVATYTGGPDEPLPGPALAGAHPESLTPALEAADRGGDTKTARSHTLDVNIDTGVAYLFGSNTCNGGPHAVDIRDPSQPTYLGCYGDQGYTHDGHCRIYAGPDVEHQGKEICFLAQGEIYVDTSEPNRIAVVDFTDKASPVLLSSFTYPDAHYSHQGALTDDEGFLLVDDELDEEELGLPMRTIVFDVSDLDSPFLLGAYRHELFAIDHNQHVVGNFVVQANYTAGVRVFALDDIGRAVLRPVGHFDVMPHRDDPVFEGSWNAFPYFASGTIVANSIYDGLFVLTPRIEGYVVGARRDD
jgi:choice-of-anchor B domain-containing protein